jgi:hypothetical protein
VCRKTDEPKYRITLNPPVDRLEIIGIAEHNQVGEVAVIVLVEEADAAEAEIETGVADIVLN